MDHSSSCVQLQYVAVIWTLLQLSVGCRNFNKHTDKHTKTIMLSGSSPCLLLPVRTRWRWQECFQFYFVVVMSRLIDLYNVSSIVYQKEDTWLSDADKSSSSLFLERGTTSSHIILAFLSLNTPLGEYRDGKIYDPHFVCQPVIPQECRLHCSWFITATI